MDAPEYSPLAMGSPDESFKAVVIDLKSFYHVIHCSPVVKFKFQHRIRKVQPAFPDAEDIVVWVDADGRHKADQANQQANHFAMSVLGLSSIVFGPVLVTGVDEYDNIANLSESWIDKIKTKHAE